MCGVVGLAQLRLVRLKTFPNAKWKWLGYKNAYGRVRGTEIAEALPQKIALRNAPLINNARRRIVRSWTGGKGAGEGRDPPSEGNGSETLGRLGSG